MPKPGTLLRDKEIREARPSTKPFNLWDVGGLYLTVSDTGAKWWRLKYRYGGRERRMGLGTYPEVSLSEARQHRDDARTLLRKGIDPLEKRQSEQLERKDAAANSFESLAREWLEKQKTKLTPVTLNKATALLEKWAFPWIGSRPVKQITTRELLVNVLNRVEDAGKLETAHRLKQRCGQIFRYAIATGRADANPTPNLRGALTTQKTRNLPSIVDPTKIGQLLRDIENYSGQFVTRCALKLSPLLFVRPGELRWAEWAEIDLDRATWNIPAAKMKMDEPHIVPLATQAIAILRELHPLTAVGAGAKYVFPATYSRQRPMSENTVNLALRRMGYTSKEIVAHGFRSMASTLLNEQGWHPDVIERQLAHAERNEVRRAYNRAKYLPERVRMMQAWADYLDALRSGAKVVSIKRSA